jgi:M3 family oligoendopeptidase
VRKLKFKEYPYQRPDLVKIKQNFQQLLQEFSETNCYEKQEEIITKVNAIRDEWDSLKSIAMIRHTCDTTDSFYEAEQDYFDEHAPVYDELIFQYYQALDKSEFRDRLGNKWGKQLFTLARLQIMAFAPEIIEDLQQENKLASKYVKLIAAAKIPFAGQERNLAQMQPFELSKDRLVRKKAGEAKWKYYADHGAQLDEIFDDLVKVRTQIAGKLGYKSFVDVGYLRMKRSDYDKDRVAGFRKQVKEKIVPIVMKLKERQRQRLGLDKLQYYDWDYNFNTGNAIPKGSPDWITEQGKRMYGELSAETREFFRVMTDNELMDLVSKHGKAGGGYCESIPQYKVPFIFSNFNGTAGDIDVLTHEAGHAFQAYLSREATVPEYYWPTSDAAEIHSMSMEFFTWPWMELFFKEDADKYRFSHLCAALTFIPYGVAVDEFQHWIYENPDAAPVERKVIWRSLERKYMPYKEYEGNEYLANGGYWQKQLHIYELPFYYIDYTLAQVCALQFWQRALRDRESAWADYLRLCRAGGSKSFLGLIELANLVSPFAEGCVSSVVKTIEDWLNRIDDGKL